MDRQLINQFLQMQDTGDDRNLYQRLMKLVKIEAGIIVALAVILSFFVVTGNRRDLHYAVTPNEQSVGMIVLSAPNRGRTALKQWVVQATTEIMTFGFNDIDERFSLSRAHFTDKGWDDFYKAMVASKLAEEVIRTQQMITSVPAGSPTVLREGLMNGGYSWVYKIPLLLTIRTGGDKRNLSKTVIVTLQELPTGKYPTGIGISEWVIF